MQKDGLVTSHGRTRLTGGGGGEGRGGAGGLGARPKAKQDDSRWWVVGDIAADGVGWVRLLQ